MEAVRVQPAVPGGAYLSTHSSHPIHPIIPLVDRKAKGFEIGCELGYYQACCRTWLAVLGRQTEEAGEAVVIADATTKER